MRRSPTPSCLWWRSPAYRTRGTVSCFHWILVPPMCVSHFLIPQHPPIPPMNPQSTPRSSTLTYAHNIPNLRTPNTFPPPLPPFPGPKHNTYVRTCIFMIAGFLVKLKENNIQNRKRHFRLTRSSLSYYSSEGGPKIATIDRCGSAHWYEKAVWTLLVVSHQQYLIILLGGPPRHEGVVQS